MSRLVISLLGLALLVDSCTIRGNVFEMSRGYVPQYNPGGDLFDEDEEFVQSYEVYKQRREDVLASSSGARDLRTDRGKGLSEERAGGRTKAPGRDIIEKLREYGAIPVDKVEGSGKGMVNKEGVDLTRVEGARFLDVDLKPKDEVAAKPEVRTPPSGGAARALLPTKSKRSTPDAGSAAKGSTKIGGTPGDVRAPSVGSRGKVSVSDVKPATAAGASAKGGTGGAPVVPGKEKEKKGETPAAGPTAGGKKAATKYFQETRKKPTVPASSTRKSGGDKAPEEKSKNAKEPADVSAVKAVPAPAVVPPIAPLVAAPSATKKEEPSTAEDAAKDSTAKEMKPSAGEAGSSKTKKAADEKPGSSPAGEGSGSASAGSVVPPAVRPSAEERAPDVRESQKLNVGKEGEGDKPAAKKTGGKRAGVGVKNRGGSMANVPRTIQSGKGAVDDKKEGVRATEERKKGIVGGDFTDSWKFDDDEYESDYIIQRMD
ncbi:TRP75-related protein [Anaplasma centrale]|nr:TRP75-related protein [Anaplasma centrale]